MTPVPKNVKKETHIYKLLRDLLRADDRSASFSYGDGAELSSELIRSEQQSGYSEEGMPSVEDFGYSPIAILPECDR